VLAVSDTIHLSVDGETGVATVTLNRPDQLNALTVEMVDAWAEAYLECAARDDVGAVVVTGAGRAFCSGGDLSTLGTDGTPIDRKSFLRDHVHRVARALDRIEQPVIAMINGAAMGAGLDMALLCDLRVTAVDAKLGEAYIKVGLVPGDGGAWLLPRLIGPSRALELLWTGRVLTGAEAAEWGLVNRAVPGDELAAATYELANSLAAGPRLATRLIKQAVRSAETMGLHEHYDLISSYMALAQSDADFAEGITAAKQKRPAKFGQGS